MAHPISALLGSDSILSSITDFADSNKPASIQDEEAIVPAKPPTTGSFLFLSIHAAADYFTLNETLMAEVPPVHVDLILDPYILNVAPRSLLPTMGYVTIVASIAWFLASFIRSRLLGVVLKIDTANGQDVKRGEIDQRKRQDRIGFFHIF